jgi:hypothetical protein
MKIVPLLFMYCSNLSCKFSRQTQKKLVGFSHYGHFSSGLRGRRKTYHTILKLGDHALFKMVWYPLCKTCPWRSQKSKKKSKKNAKNGLLKLSNLTIAQLYGLPHGIIRVFNTILYENFNEYLRNYQDCLTLLYCIFC